MTSAPLTCDEVEALLPMIADGQLDEVSDPTLFTHLADCPRCAGTLATHDLISLALAPTVVGAPRRGLRFPVWATARTWLPRAAAAVVLVALGASFSSLRPSAASPSVSLTAVTKTHAASATVVQPAHVAHAEATEPIQIDMEVVTVPGSTPSHPRYLVRRGEQVLLVDPTAGPADAVPATYAKPSSHERIRRY